MGVLWQIHSEFAAHKANICSFWLVTLDNAKGKQVCVCVCVCDIIYMYEMMRIFLHLSKCLPLTVFIFFVLTISLSFLLFLLLLPQLLAPVREAVKCLLHCHWRRADLRSVRLHHITTRLMAFLVGRGGEGLWASIEPLE